MLSVSRQSPYVMPKVPSTGIGERVPLRLVTPPLPAPWATMECTLGIVDLDVGVSAMARRHPVAGHRKVTSLPHRPGFVVNKMRVARLRRARGFTRDQKKRHPKVEGRLLRTSRPNER